MRYFLDPFGCVKNQVDAENMMACLNNAGWAAAADAADADLIIVNSCGFIESAKQESINAVLEWRSRYPRKKILLAGCLAQRYAKELAESLPEADGFFGVDNPAGIVETAVKAAGVTEEAAEKKPEKKQKFLKRAVRRPKKEYGVTAARPLLSLPGSAYVKISEGCNNRCAFCAIPLIRGGLRSRSIRDIREECRGLLARGVFELCIIGQDIGSYGTEGRGGLSRLPGLLKAISALKGKFWVRLLYIHPDHFPLQILDIMERDKRFIPYFDIPFQHGSPKILAAMNRQGTAESYLGLIKTIRRRLPSAVIRSTFLLGFPGETEDDFAALLDFQEKARLDWLGCFTWSREDGTAAYSMTPRVSSKIAARRKRIVEKRQVPITEKNMDNFAGQKLEALIEEQIESGEDSGESIWLGRLYCQAPEVDGAAVIVCGTESGGNAALKPGVLVPCTVIARRGFDLEVRVI
jgi:ribosomal protein S12 methylthiotransferase